MIDGYLDVSIIRQTWKKVAPDAKPNTTTTTKLYLSAKDDNKQIYNITTMRYIKKSFITRYVRA